MLDDPAAHKIVERYFPELVSSPQIGMARGMTFNAIRVYMPQVMTDAKLKAMDAELAKLPKKK